LHLYLCLYLCTVRHGSLGLGALCGCEFGTCDDCGSSAPFVRRDCRIIIQFFYLRPTKVEGRAPTAVSASNEPVPFRTAVRAARGDPRRTSTCDPASLAARARASRCSHRTTYYSTMLLYSVSAIALCATAEQPEHPLAILYDGMVVGVGATQSSEYAWRASLLDWSQSLLETRYAK